MIGWYCDYSNNVLFELSSASWQAVRSQVRELDIRLPSAFNNAWLQQVFEDSRNAERVQVQQRDLNNPYKNMTWPRLRTLCLECFWVTAGWIHRLLSFHSDTLENVGLRTIAIRKTWGNEPGENIHG
jgi:hypothetical protein